MRLGQIVRVVADALQAVACASRGIARIAANALGTDRGAVLRGGHEQSRGGHWVDIPNAMSTYARHRFYFRKPSEVYIGGHPSNPLGNRDHSLDHQTGPGQWLRSLLEHAIPRSQIE